MLWDGEKYSSSGPEGSAHLFENILVLDDMLKNVEGAYHVKFSLIWNMACVQL